MRACEECSGAEVCPEFVQLPVLSTGSPVEVLYSTSRGMAAQCPNSPIKSFLQARPRHKPSRRWREGKGQISGHVVYLNRLWLEISPIERGPFRWRIWWLIRWRSLSERIASDNGREGKKKDRHTRSRGPVGQDELGHQEAWTTDLVPTCRYFAGNFHKDQKVG